MGAFLWEETPRKDSLLDKMPRNGYTEREVIAMRDIGKNIRTLRIRRGLTQDELAEALFVTRQTVSNYETGRSRPDVEMLLNIAQVLEADIHHLLYGLPVEEDRRRDKRRLLAAAIAVILLTILQIVLTPLSQEAIKRHGDGWLYFLLNVVLSPVTMLLLGWAAMQAVGLIFHLHPATKPWMKLARRAILVGISLAAAVTIGLCLYALFRQVFGLQMQIDAVASRMEFWLLGSTAWGGTTPILMLLGGLLWYLGFPTGRT